jgi:hypothetical protein
VRVAENISAGKPSVLPPIFENIPPKMRELDQFGTWAYEEFIDEESGECSYDKIPRNSRTGRRASSTDPNTWSTFDQAVKAYERGGYDGLAFFLKPGGGLVGIDLDKCRDRTTGAIEEWAQSTVDRLGTYCELSPSGRGLRLFVWGELPPRDRREGRFECYSSARFLTLTGWRITPFAIEHRQAELNEIHTEIFAARVAKRNAAPPALASGYRPHTLSDLEILELAGRAKNGDKFRSLYHGGDTSGYRSHSEADLALCGMLAFYAGPDVGRVDELLLAEAGRSQPAARTQFNRVYVGGVVMPHKKAPAQAYRLEVVAPVNGRVHKASIKAFDAEGKLAYTDRAKLDESAERRKAAKRMAAALKLRNPAKVDADLEQAWNAGVQQQERQKAEADAAERQKDSAPEENQQHGAYFVERGRICRRRFGKDGEVFTEALCNFTAQIEAETTYDDGSGEVQHCFRVAGKLADGRPLAAVDVPAGDFVTMNWPIKNWGVAAIVSPGQGAKDHLRCALQEMSKDAPRNIVFRQTGWRKIGGKWLYLHSGGAIGTVGTVSQHIVDLPGNLSLITLPDPPEGESLADAVRASLRILDLARERITAPVLGAVYRAPFGAVDFAAHLVGPSGSFKTELAARAQEHWGAGLDSRHLPGSWSSTANALESLLFTAADMLVVIDDFAPGGSQADVARFHRDADRVIRSAGNRSARMRLRADGELRPPRPPRCLPLSTGEETPKGHSVRGRLGIIEVSKGDIDAARLTECQAVGRAGLYAAAMSAYLR